MKSVDANLLIIKKAFACTEAKLVFPDALLIKNLFERKTVLAKITGHRIEKLSDVRHKTMSYK